MKKRSLLVGAFVFWATFTLALLMWWVIFSFRQLESIKSLNLGADAEILKHQKMLIYEGVTLFACLLVGACALIFFIVRENKILRERKNFLSLFTHDLKTTISSLRLMLERLSQHSHDSALKSEVKEIQGIGTRLSQQLQNALQVTYQSKQNLVLEALDFGDQINYLRHQWPDLSFKVSDKALVLADATALRSICINLIQNAVDHAQANEIVFKVDELSKDFIQIKCLTPGGRALPVSVEDFRKHLRAFQSIDGSGVGLKLTLEMMSKMGGRARFDVDKKGVLEVSLVFKKAEVRK